MIAIIAEFGDSIHAFHVGGDIFITLMPPDHIPGPSDRDAVVCRLSPTFNDPQVITTKVMLPIRVDANGLGLREPPEQISSPMVPRRPLWVIYGSI